MTNVEQRKKTKVDETTAVTLLKGVHAVVVDQAKKHLLTRNLLTRRRRSDAANGSFFMH